MSITNALDQLVSAMEACGVPVRSGVHAGLQREEIAHRISKLGLEPPLELYELYQWGNGTVEECQIPLFDEHYFLTIENAVHEYQQAAPYWVQGSNLFGIDFSGCFPFAGFNGSYYTIYCYKDPIHDDVHPEISFYHPIIHIFQDVAIYFLSIETMALTMAKWYREGAYNLRTIDQELKERIWSELNPGIDLNS